MQSLNKNILTWVAAVLMVFLIVFLGASTDKILNTSTNTNTISFSGEGKVVAKPDIAVVNFSIVTEGTTSKDAQDKNSTRSKTVTDFLKKQGVSDKDIKTTSYNIYPQYSYPRYDTPEIKGYQTSQGFELKIRELDKASDIIDGLVTAGANNITGLQFQVDDQEKLKDEARAKAITDAKTKAKALEKQLGISLGKIVNFSENSGGYPPILYGKALSSEDLGGGPSLPTGENEITVNITITYQIK